MTKIHCDSCDKVIGERTRLSLVSDSGKFLGVIDWKNGEQFFDVCDACLNKGRVKIKKWKSQ